jgi:carboxymethylenebutenolidase
MGVVGFSFGAAWALWLPTKRPSVTASVVYYGSMSGPVLSRATSPVLGHFAEQDPYEPEENLTAMEADLRAGGRAVTIHRYPGTGHWFAEPSKPAYVRDAAELAFERTVAFLRDR